MVKEVVNIKKIERDHSSERLRQLEECLEGHGFRLHIWGGFNYIPRITKKGWFTGVPEIHVDIEGPASFNTLTLFAEDEKQLYYCRRISKFVEDETSLQCTIKIGFERR